MRYLIFVISMLFSICCNAQSKVFLKNGSMLKGEIVEISDRNLVIKVLNADYTLNQDQIQYVYTSTKRGDTLKAQLAEFNEVVNDRKFEHNLSIGLFADATEQDGAFVNADISSYYKLTDHFRAGAAMGYNEWVNTGFVSFQALARYQFKPFGNSIYWLGGLGGAKAWNKNEMHGTLNVDGGLILRTGFGYKLDLNGRYSINLYAGWRQQRLKQEGNLYSWWDSNYITTTKLKVNVMDLQVGFGF